MESRDETRMLSRALHCLHDAVALVDSDEAIVYANPALEELTGIPREELEGSPVDDVLVDTSSQPRVLSLQGRTQRQGELLHRDGSRIPVRWTAMLVSAPETGFFSTYTFHDLRPEMRSERLEEKLRHSERLTLLGQVFGGVAHELNNPLTHIMLTTELLARAEDPQRRAQLRERIRSSTERCRQILKGVLGVVHKGQPEIRRQSPLEPVQEIVDIIQKPFSYDGIEVSLEADEVLPPVPFDRGKLQQVVTNLLKNSRDALVDAGRRGSIRVTLGRGEDDGVELAVADDGPGIPPEIRDRVGKAFFTTKPAGRGTGLGLSICRSLIREHGGELALEDREGGGLVVRVTLRAELPAAASPGSRPPMSLASVEAAAAHCRSSFEGRRVLVIDDETDSLEALRSSFEALRVESVEVASCAGEALEHLRDREFDLVVCDVRMPGMSGITLYQIAQVAFPEQARRFLFLTAYASDERTARFLSTQSVPRLDKPCELPALEEAAARVLVR